jgi:hypothetical protein
MNPADIDQNEVPRGASFCFVTPLLNKLPI